MKYIQITAAAMAGAMVVYSINEDGQPHIEMSNNTAPTLQLGAVMVSTSSVVSSRDLAGTRSSS